MKRSVARSATVELLVDLIGHAQGCENRENAEIVFTAQRGTCMHSADNPVARCLSVFLFICLSHAGILSKRLNMSSKFFH